MNVCRIMRKVRYQMSIEELTRLQAICSQKDSGKKYQEFKDETLEDILAYGMNKQFIKRMVV